ncbi:ATP-binding protein [Parvibaculum sp. MBR-TMA-1.3b-4.2]|jgi:PAS domain S-box-containing protein
MLRETFTRKELVDALFKGAREAAIFADTDRRIVSVNPSTLEIFGYEEDELLGQPTSIFYADETQFHEQGKLRFNDSAREGTSSYRVDYKRKSGEIFQGETIAGPVRGEDGEVLGHFGLIRDMSDEARVEKSLHALYDISTDQRRTIEQKIQAILELGAQHFSLEFGIVARVKGDEYTIEYATSPDRSLERGSVFQLNNTYCIHTLTANDVTAFHNAGNSKIARHPCYREFQLETYIGIPLTVDGKLYGTVNFSSPTTKSVPFTARDKEFMRQFEQWISSELQKMAAYERLLQARRDADSANQTKSRFLATMSHELRTPMTGIFGMLDMLGTTSLTDEQKSYLRQSRQCADNLLTLLNDVLDLSKVEAGRLTLESIPLQPRELVDSIASTNLPVAQKKGVAIRVDSDISLPAVLCDPTRMRQVLTNLVSNAIKFTREGSVTLGCHAVSTDADSATLRFEVSDTGVGIAPDKIDHIFEAFSQADKNVTRLYGGTGLGLSICKRLVETMGGEIEVESEPYRGSTFRFEVRFPLASGDTAAAGRKLAEPYPDEEMSDGQRILVAEDNEVNGMLLDGMLSRMGYNVTLVENGAEALKAVQSAHFDAAVFDMNMPVMDGVEATQHIRALGTEAAKMPIIALTADAILERRQQYLDIGLTEFLTKPINWAVLQKALRDHTQKKTKHAPDVTPIPSELTLFERELQNVPLRESAQLDELEHRLGSGALGTLVISSFEAFDCFADKLRRDLAGGKPEESRATLHSLKGTALNFGAKRLGMLAAELQRLVANEPEKEKFEGLVTRLKPTIQETRKNFEERYKVSLEEKPENRFRA